jgi:hypothetical protein
MDGLPGDLIPLPTRPWDIRPAEIPLDTEECRTALWMTRGNVTEAAAILKITSMRLRQFIDKSEYLKREQSEAKEQLLDKAEFNVYEALNDIADPGRKDSMTRFVLTNLGTSRGYGNGKAGVNVNPTGKGRMVIMWDDGTGISGDPESEGEVIEGHVVNE